MNLKDIKITGAQAAFIIGLLLFGSFALLIMPRAASAPDPSQVQMSSEQPPDSYSNAKIIDESIQAVKDNMTLPFRLDEKTLLVDVTGETDAVRYHYILSGYENTGLVGYKMKGTVVPMICQTAQMVALMDMGIEVRYTFVIENTPQEILISVSREDCPN